jgi:hypothetical protein
MAPIDLPRFPEEGDFVRLARMVWRRALAAAKPRISSTWFDPRGRSGAPKNKISTGAELLLPIGYYAAAG